MVKHNKNTIMFGKEKSRALQAASIIVFTLVMGIPHIAYSSSGISKQSGWVTLLGNLYSVTYGKGLFVAVGNRGYTALSPDGKHWKTLMLVDRNGHPVELRGIAYGRNTFVAVGQNGVVMVSGDGHEWVDVRIARPAGGNDDLYDIAFGNGVFLALGKNGIYAATNPLDKWEYRPLPQKFKVEEDMSRLFYERGAFFLVNINYKQSLFVFDDRYKPVYTSVDGTTWSPPGDHRSVRKSCGAGKKNEIGLNEYGEVVIRDPKHPQTQAMTIKIPYTHLLRDIACGPPGYVVVGFGGVILFSEDGTDWQRISGGWQGHAQAMALGPNGTLLTVEQFGQPILPGAIALVGSTVGLWRMIDLRTSAFATDALFAYGGYYVSFDNGVLVRIEPGNWGQVNPYELSRHNEGISDLIFKAGRLVAVSSGDGIFYSDDGKSWRGAQVPGRPQLTSVAYGGGKFVAVGRRAAVFASQDGSQWSDMLPAVDADFEKVVWDGGHFVALDSNHKLYLSEQATTWSQSDLKDGFGFSEDVCFPMPDIADISHSPVFPNIEGISIHQTTPGVSIVVIGKDARRFCVLYNGRWHNGKDIIDVPSNSYLVNALVADDGHDVFIIFNMLHFFTGNIFRLVVKGQW